VSGERIITCLQEELVANEKTDFLHLDAEEIAKQISLTDFEKYKSIHSLEFIAFFWNKKNVCLSSERLASDLCSWDHNAFICKRFLTALTSFADGLPLKSVPRAI
jgi:hypothetical protein